jgi:hypothetical protein
MMLVRQRPNRQPRNSAIAANRRELLQLDLTSVTSDPAYPDA